MRSDTFFECLLITFQLFVHWARADVPRLTALSRFGTVSVPNNLLLESDGSACI